ncbi:NUDIX hydrolase [Vibrio breoganii]
MSNESLEKHVRRLVADVPDGSLKPMLSHTSFSPTVKAIDSLVIDEIKRQISLGTLRGSQLEHEFPEYKLANPKYSEHLDSGSSSHAVYANPFFSIQRERHGDFLYHWLRSNGESVEGVAGACIVVADANGVLMVEIERPALHKTHLEFPRGGRDKGEKSSDTARRELEEETGLETTDLGVVRLGRLAIDGGLMSSYVDVYLIELDDIDLRSYCESPNSFDEEISSLHYVTFEDFDEMVSAGRITDSLTISAMMLLSLDD